MAEAVTAYLALHALIASPTTPVRICSWITAEREVIATPFARFAFPIVWDFAEGQSTSQTSGGYIGAVEWIASCCRSRLELHQELTGSDRSRLSAASRKSAKNSIVILTDPPYYDAIPYSDLMDFFYVWLRSTLFGPSPAIDRAIP